MLLVGLPPWPPLPGEWRGGRADPGWLCCVYVLGRGGGGRRAARLVGLGCARKEVSARSVGGSVWTRRWEEGR